MPPPSKIDLLDESIRLELDQEIIKRGFADYVGLSQWLAERGCSIGKSTLADHGKNLKVERRLNAVKVATLAAITMEDAARDPTDARSNSIYAQFQTGIFDAVGAVLDAEDEIDPAKKLALLTRAGKDFAALGRGNMARQKWATEYRTKLDAARAEVKKLATGAGVSAETMEAIDKRLQGVV